MDCLRPTSDMAKESPYGCLAYFTEHLNLPTNGRQRKPKDFRKHSMRLSSLSYEKTAFFVSTNVKSGK